MGSQAASVDCTIASNTRWGDSAEGTPDARVHGVGAGSLNRVGSGSGSGRVGEGEGGGRAERTAVEEVRLEVFAVQHEKALGLRPCRRGEGAGGAAENASHPGGQGQQVRAVLMLGRG